MNKLITIGILDTGATTDEYERRFHPWGYPDKITPGKRTAKYDLIVIPDGISCNPTMQCFRGSYEPIGLPRMDHKGEIFRVGVRGLQYYKEECLIVGVGDGATMLWNELNYRAVVVGEKAQIKFVKEGTDLDVIWKGDDLFVEEWRKLNFVGISNLWSPNLNSLMVELSNNIKKEIDSVKDTTDPGVTFRRRSV